MKNNFFEEILYIEVKLRHCFTKVQYLNFHYQFCLKDIGQLRFLNIDNLCFFEYCWPIIMFLWIFFTKFLIPE